MTQLDTFRATVQHEPHDGLLFHAGFTPDLARRVREDRGLAPDGDIGAHFGMFGPRGVGLRAPHDLEVLDFSKYYADMNVPKDATIDDRGVLHVPSGFYHFDGMVGPLRNATRFEEIEAFPYPNVEGWTDDHMADAVREAHEQGRPAVCWIGHMFEDAWQIRGMAEFLTDMAAEPEWAEHILDRLMERNLAIATAAARAGADYLHTGDDVATQQALMFSPEQWRRVVRERIDTLGGDGALMLAPTHVLEPEVPLENIYAFVEAAGGVV